MKRFIVYSKTHKEYLPYMRSTLGEAKDLAKVMFATSVTKHGLKMENIVIREVEIKTVAEHKYV